MLERLELGRGHSAPTKARIGGPSNRATVTTAAIVSLIGLAPRVAPDLRLPGPQTFSLGGRH